MIDSRRKLLTEALKKCWHNFYFSCSPFCIKCGAHEEDCKQRTFAEPSDYEALREKVIVPHNEVFSEYVWNRWVKEEDRRDWLFPWWLSLSPEERCELICDFGIACLGWEEKNG